MQFVSLSGVVRRATYSPAMDDLLCHCLEGSGPAALGVDDDGDEIAMLAINPEPAEDFRDRPALQAPGDESSAPRRSVGRRRVVDDGAFIGSRRKF